LPCGSFNWGLVLDLEAELLMPPDTDYIIQGERYATLVEDLPEAKFARMFLDRILPLTLQELQEIHRSAFGSI